MKKISIVFIVLFAFAGCEKSSSELSADGSQESKELGPNKVDIENPFPEYIDVEVTDADNAGFRYPHWDGVLDERGFDPFDPLYPEGAVHEMNVWEVSPDDSENKELIINKKYDSNERVSQLITFFHGDESLWDYFYDSYGRLIKIEELYNGVAVQDRFLTYEYSPYDLKVDSVSRAVFKNNQFEKNETERFEKDLIVLEIDFDDKRTDETKTLKFQHGNLIEYVDSGNFDYVFKFKNEFNRIVEIDEDSMFIDEFYYSDNGLLQESVKVDIRNNNRSIIRIQKAILHDEHGNWLRKELFEDDVLVGVVEREISYYD